MGVDNRLEKAVELRDGRTGWDSLVDKEWTYYDQSGY